MVFCKKNKKKNKIKTVTSSSMPTIYEQPGLKIDNARFFPSKHHNNPVIVVSSSKQPPVVQMNGRSEPGAQLQKPQQFRQIEVSVTAFLETINQQKNMYKVKLPHFVIHDFDDNEESKIFRVIFTLADIPYANKTIQRDDYILEDYPFYALPALEIDGKKLGSVPSICRQLGWRYELSGQTAREDSTVDMIAEKIFETRMLVKNWLDHIEHREEHDCDETCSTNTAIETIDILCRQLEDILKEKDSTWFVGHKMTWADLLSACLFNTVAYQEPSLLEPYPHLYLHTKRISEIDRLSGFFYHLKDVQKIFNK